MRKNSLKTILITLLAVLIGTVFFACGNNSTKTLEAARQSAIQELVIVREGFQDQYYSLSNIGLLNLILEDATERIKQADESGKIPPIVGKAKNDFESVLTLVQEEQLRQENLIREFALYKKSLQDQLDLYRAMLDDSRYSNSNVEHLNNIVTTAKDEIFHAATYFDVVDIYDTAVQVLFMVLTIEETNALILEDAKQVAVQTLQNFRASLDNIDYDEEGIIELDNIVLIVIGEISLVETLSEVERILQGGLISLNNISKVILGELDIAKRDALSELERVRFSFNNELYTDDGVLELNQIFDNAGETIQNSIDIVEVEETLFNAEIEFSNVKTYIQILDIYKSEAVITLQNYRNAKQDIDYSVIGIIALNTILQNAMDAILNTSTFESVDVLVQTTKESFDGVDVLGSEIDNFKNNQILELKLYRESFSNSDYTEKGNFALDTIFVDAELSIIATSNQDEIMQIMLQARQQMNSVFNYSQELAAAKIDLAAELEVYRNQFIDSGYSEEGISQLNYIFINALTDINAALNFIGLNAAFDTAKLSMDSVLTYTQELAYKKINAISQIQDFRDGKSDAAFSENGIKELDEILLYYINLISAEIVIANISILQNVAETALNSVLTYSQELLVERVDKVSDLREYFNLLKTVRYTDEGAILLEIALQTGIDILNNAPTLQRLHDEFILAKVRLDEVKTYEQELIDAKQAAEAALRLYRSSKLNSEFTEEGIIRLDQILTDALEEMWIAENFVQIAQAQNRAINNLDAVSTYAQELETLKGFLIIDIQLHRALKQDVNYEANGVASLNSALQNGILQIQNAVSIAAAINAFNSAVLNLDSVPNANQGVQAARDAAETALRAHRAAKNDADYDSASISELNAAEARGIANIGNAATNAAITAALSNAIAEIDAILTVSEALNIAKSEALIELRAYRSSKNNADYSSYGITELNNMLLNGEIAIDSAQYLSAITNALANAKSAMDSVLTYAEENDYDIWDVIDNAIEELDVYLRNLGSDNYGQRGSMRLQDILSDAMMEIINVSTRAQVLQILHEAQNQMNAVPQFREEYQVDILNYRNTFIHVDFAQSGVVELDAILNVYLGLIENSAVIDQAVDLVYVAIAAMDNVSPLSGQSRGEIKASAIDEITKYRENMHRDAYNSENNAELDWHLIQAIQDIRLSATEEQIQNILLAAKKQMDAVLTNAQIEAIEWINQYREEFFDDNDYLEDNVDLIDNVVQQFIDNILNFDCLKTALVEAIRALDSIQPLVGKSRQEIKDDFINEMIQFRSTLIREEYDLESNEMMDDIVAKAVNEISMTGYLDPSLLASIVASAKAQLEIFLTLKEEAIIELLNYRDSFNDDEYSVTAIQELNRILQEFSIADFAPNEIQHAVQAAKSAMDSVLTLKDEFIMSLMIHRASFDESLYSHESVAELDRILQEFISGVFNFNELADAFSAAKAAMDAVSQIDDVP